MSREANFPAQQQVADGAAGRTGPRTIVQMLATTLPDAHVEFGRRVAISHRGDEQQGGRVVERWASAYGLGIVEQAGGPAA